MVNSYINQIFNLLSQYNMVIQADCFLQGIRNLNNHRWQVLNIHSVMFEFKGQLDFFVILVRLL